MYAPFGYGGATTPPPRRHHAATKQITNFQPAGLALIQAPPGAEDVGSDVHGGANGLLTAVTHAVRGWASFISEGDHFRAPAVQLTLRPCNSGHSSREGALRTLLAGAGF